MVLKLGAKPSTVLEERCKGELGGQATMVSLRPVVLALLASLGE